ncbi:hypothetical protein D0T57_12310 [Dysgonomonas sp. 511]|nr:hypothetical protein [Dysgonomonas sp. 511]
MSDTYKSIDTMIAERKSCFLSRGIIVSMYKDRLGVSLSISKVLFHIKYKDFKVKNEKYKDKKQGKCKKK